MILLLAHLTLNQRNIKYINYGHIIEFLQSSCHGMVHVLDNQILWTIEGFPY
jgi:hypothetical protein